jgi:hypothetical protein
MNSALFILTLIKFTAKASKMHPHPLIGEIKVY